MNKLVNGQLVTMTNEEIAKFENSISLLEKTYEELVEQYIREKYSISDEFAIQRQKEIKPQEFQIYFDYCESCKARARLETS